MIMKNDSALRFTKKREPQTSFGKLRARIRFINKSLRLNIRTILACEGLIDDYKHEINSINIGDRSPIGWFTYPFLEHLLSCDLSQLRVFEWGGGNSSLWWSQKCREVVTVENESYWFSFIKNKTEKIKNLHLMLVQDHDSYVNSLAGFNRSDVVVIDGHWRYDCAKSALAKIPPTTLIILDNSDWCPDTCSIIQEQGYARIDFPGFGPANQFTWCTSIFFRSLEHPLLRPLRSPSSLGGVEFDQSGYMFEGEHEK